MRNFTQSAASTNWKSDRRPSAWRRKYSPRLTNSSWVTLFSSSRVFRSANSVFQVQLDAQLVPDFQIPGGDHVEHLSAVHPVAGVGVTEMGKSVILWSCLSRFPAAETTTTRRSGSERTMSRTFRYWSAEAMEGPAEFRYFQHVSIPSFPSGSAREERSGMILEPTMGLGHGYLLGDDGFAPTTGGVTFQPAVRVGRRI